MESAEELQLLHYEHDQDNELSLSRDDVGNGGQGHEHKTEVMASTSTLNQDMEKSEEQGYSGLKTQRRKFQSLRFRLISASWESVCHLYENTN